MNSLMDFSLLLPNHYRHATYCLDAMTPTELKRRYTSQPVLSRCANILNIMGKREADWNTTVA